MRRISIERLAMAAAHLSDWLTWMDVHSSRDRRVSSRVGRKLIAIRAELAARLAGAR